jgi:inner membrane transporter RhtA
MDQLSRAWEASSGGWPARAVRGVPAPALVLGSLTVQQLGAALAKGLFPEVGAVGVVLLRIGLAAVLLLVVWRPRLPVPGRASGRWWPLLAFGLVIAGMNLAFYSALARAPLGIVATVELLGPLGVAAALSRRAVDLLWTALAGLGVALLGSGGGRTQAAGIGLALLAAALRAGYVLLSRRVGRRFAGGDGLALALGVGALALAPIGVAGAGPELLRPRVLLLGAVVAVLSSALPYTLDLAALRRLPAQVFGVLLSLGPAIAALVGVVVLHERLRLREWLAVGLVVLASAGTTWANRAPPDPEPEAGAA